MQHTVQWHIDKKLVHEIHTSERKSFRGCRRRWDWIFRENYYPVMTPKPFDFGTAFHKALEVYYNPAMWDMPREAMAQMAIKAFNDKSKEQEKKALAAGAAMDDEVEQDFKERKELGIGMLNHFFKFVAPEWDRDWQPLGVEVSFMVPILHPDTGEQLWCKCEQCWAKHGNYYNKLYNEQGEAAANAMEEDTFVNGEWPGFPVVYAGRIDCVGMDKHGQEWIIDWKTAARLSVDNHKYLFMDDQVGSYVWALWTLGRPVAGFVYHEQKKGFSQAPERMKVVRKGCSFSVSKSQDTDYDTYLRTIMAEDEAAWKAGYYNDFLQWLEDEGPKFYFRAEVHKSLEEMQEIGRNIGLEALDMLDTNLRIYPNPGRFACNNCAFQEPCTEKNAKGDYEYFLETVFERREAYYLREDLSTDKKSAL